MLFYSVANRAYEKYVPWFIYFLSQSYPKSYAHIDLSCNLSDTTKKCLEIISKDTDYKFFVNRDQFKSFHTENPYVMQTLRWLIIHDIFNKYEYLWIGDIDMCICKEDPSMIQQHISHMNRYDIPFSNYKRSGGIPRMAGIHIVETNKWLDLMMDDINSIRKNLNNTLMNLKIHTGKDEQILHRLIYDNIGDVSKSCSINEYHNFVSSIYHGYHIRLIEWKGIPGIKSQHNSHIYIKELRKYINTNIFNDMFKISPEVGGTLLNFARQY